jgi:hypothetical protein
MLFEPRTSTVDFSYEEPEGSFKMPPFLAGMRRPGVPLAAALGEIDASCGVQGQKSVG